MTKTVFIDVSKVSSSKEFHEILKEAFGLPEFYGMSWDAFWDSITGFIEMPDKIELTGWMHLRKVLAVDSEAFLKCLLEYNDIPNVKQIQSYLR